MSNYGTLAASKTYHSERGNSAWAAETDDAVLTIALVRASEYIDSNFSFQGTRVGGRSQTDQWPRYGVYDDEGNSVSSDSVPVEVENATYEAALRELASTGALTPDVTLGTQTKRVKVEGAVEVEYANPSGVNAAKPIITIIQAILSPLLAGSGSGYSSISGEVSR